LSLLHAAETQSRLRPMMIQLSASKDRTKKQEVFMEVSHLNADQLLQLLSTRKPNLRRPPELKSIDLSLFYAAVYRTPSSTSIFSLLGTLFNGHSILNDTLSSTTLYPQRHSILNDTLSSTTLCPQRHSVLNDTLSSTTLCPQRHSVLNDTLSSTTLSSTTLSLTAYHL
jgi:hypothetical protein